MPARRAYVHIPDSDLIEVVQAEVEAASEYGFSVPVIVYGPTLEELYFNIGEKVGLIVRKFPSEDYSYLFDLSNWKPVSEEEN